MNTPSPDVDLHRLIAHALWTGMCPLIPIPFLDDWVRDGIRRRSMRRIVEDSSAPMPGDDRVRILANGHDPVTASGCASGCLRKTVTLPLNFLFKLVFKKILRKIVFVLALKDCVDTFSATFHEGFLTAHALRHEDVRRGLLADDKEPTITLRKTVERVRDEVDHRPVERWVRKAFQGSRRLLGRTAVAVGRRLRALRRKEESPDDERIYDEVRGDDGALGDEGALGDLVDELTAEIAGEASYLEGLRLRLDRRLAGDDTPFDPTPSVAEVPPETESPSNPEEPTA